MDPAIIQEKAWPSLTGLGAGFQKYVVHFSRTGNSLPASSFSCLGPY